MAGTYDVLVQFGDDLIPLNVPKSGTFRDLKRMYQEIFDVPISRQVWGGRIGDLGVDDDFPLSGMGLENCEPLSVFSSEAPGGSNSGQLGGNVGARGFSSEFYDQDTGQLSPRTAAAIAASLETPTPQKDPSSVRIPIGAGNDVPTGPSRAYSPLTVEEIGSETHYTRQTSSPPPIVISDDDNDDDLQDLVMVDAIDDFDTIREESRQRNAMDRRTTGMDLGFDFGSEAFPGGVRLPSPSFPTGPAAGSPWSDASALMDRMTSMMDGPGFGMRAPLGGRTGEVLGYLGPGKFASMYLTGREKTSFLQLINANVVLAQNWRLAFPSRGMANASPIHYPNPKIEDAIDDAHNMNQFVALHIFDQNHSECCDFYNMIVSSDNVQGVYADNYVSYFVSVNRPIELSALSKLLSPSQARPPTLQLPVVLLMATMKGRLHILDMADSSLSAPAYIDKLILLRETYAPQIAEDKLLDMERRSQSSLVDEQNNAFEISQRQDQERAAAEEAESRRLQREAETREMEAAAERQLELDQAMISANMRSYCRSQYIENMTKLPSEPTEGRNTTIALRLNDGSKVQRKFNPETTTLADVFTFAAGSMAQKATDESFVDPNEPTQPWSIEKFDLSAQFPARRFSHSQASQTLKQLGLSGQELLNLVESSK